MNHQLIDRMKEKLLSEPDTFDMSVWILNRATNYDEPRCNTTHCLAGMIATLSGYEREPFWTPGEVYVRPVPSSGRDPLAEDIETVAARELGVSQAKARNLFFISGWPHDLAAAYRNTESSAERARIAVQVLDRFVKSDGFEVGGEE